ncbi:MAG: peptidyl-prolyl cis-trans isomerase [Armatimonadetes bacterium]|nr:peptidyl-prolyl cis-trans isomerase [Armatimonadota bacterium]MDW8120925.1 peptidyl-prolyl cis-trans isomerase [Armatimonadota bacterium]
MKRQKPTVGVCVLMVLLVPLVGCRRESGPIVATVNGMVIHREELESLLWRRYGPSVTRELILLKLLEKEAAQRGITVTDEEIRQKAKVASSLSSFPDAFAAKRELLLDKLSLSLAEVSEEEAQRYFREHHQEFEEPEKVHLKEITLSDRESALAVYEALRRLKGSNFDALARHFSVNEATRKKGGDMGMVPVRDLHPALQKAVVSLKEKGFSRPVSVNGEWVIVKVEKRWPAVKKAYEEVREIIYRRLKEQKAWQLRLELPERLRKSAKIRIVDQRLQEGIRMGEGGF